MRLLLVDDEIRVLEGLERMLIQVSDDDDLEIATAASARDALAKLASEPFDVVISDMRMPGMDGADLLERVHQLHPQMVRVILSGHMGEDAALRSARHAHQFLAKPCGTAVLHETLGRARMLSRIIASPSVRSVIGGVDRLPSVPENYHELGALLARESSDLNEIAAVVERDPALTAKVMQMVNTAFFGRSAPVTQLRQALTRIGVRTLQALALSIDIFQSAAEISFPPRTTVAAIQQKALKVARIARALAGEPAFLAGLLSDLGALVVGSTIARDHVPDDEQLSSEDQLVVEFDALGTCHSEVGAYLLVLWAFPMEIVEAVARHHDMDASAAAKPSIASAVYWATCLVEGLPVAAADLEIFAPGALAALGDLS